MGKHLIFVYGTLKRGWGNNAIIHDQEFLGKAKTLNDHFQMYTLGGFPGVVRGEKEISGEAWLVDDAAFVRCDRLEGNPSFYKREEVDIIIENYKAALDELETAWIYIYQGDVSGRKPIDNWTR